MYMNQFDTHIQQLTLFNYHPKLAHVCVSKDSNLLLYGPPGTGKYSQALWYLRNKSPSELKYERRMTVTCDKEPLHLRVSDIHYEVDMSMLSKTMWHELYIHICNSIAAKPTKWGVILCLNFQETNSELMDVFYSYMQHNDSPTYGLKVTFMLVSTDMCVIPDAVVHICNVIRIPRPSVTHVKQTYHQTLCDTIVNQLEQAELHNPFPFAEFREQLYQLSVHQLHLPTCIWYIVGQLPFKATQMRQVTKYILEFFQLYNNNCHPIYHLERLMFNILSVLHGIDRFSRT